MSKNITPRKWHFASALGSISGSFFVAAISQNLLEISVFLGIHEVRRGVFSHLVNTYMNQIIHDHTIGFATSLISAASKTRNGKCLCMLTLIATSSNISLWWTLSAVIVAIDALSVIVLKD